MWYLPGLEKAAVTSTLSFQLSSLKAHVVVQVNMSFQKPETYDDFQTEYTPVYKSGYHYNCIKRTSGENIKKPAVTRYLMELIFPLMFFFYSRVHKCKARLTAECW